MSLTAVLVRLMAISTLAVAGFPAASVAADVTGTWNTSASTMGPCEYSGQMTLEQIGSTFTGVASLSLDSGSVFCPSTAEGSISSGLVSGLDVSFTFSSTVIVSGALTADQVEMSGELSGELYDRTFSGRWSATRVPPCVSPAPEGCPGPAVAFVRALAIDPTTPRTLYAGTGRYFGDGSGIGGVLKSTDGGSIWSASNTGLLSPVYVLAVDPTTPSTLFAGTRDSVGRTGGVYKSTDRGSTWGAVNTGLPATEISVEALAIDPTTPGTLYVGVRPGGVFKSTDGGSTWGAVNTGLPTTEISVTALAIDPSAPDTLYAGTAYGDGGGVYKSTDGGSTWGPANTGLPTDIPVLALAVGPTAPSTVYAGTAFFGVLKSTDGGGTWVGANYADFMDTVISTLAIDPTTPGKLYAAGGGVYRSTDGGSSWLLFNTGLPSGIHVEALVIDPTTTPSTLYAGAADGVFSIQLGGCIGDCGGDGTVTIDELVTGVRIALDTLPLDECPSLDAGDDDVTVDELIAGVSNALNGCPTEGME